MSLIQCLVWRRLLVKMLLVNLNLDNGHVIIGRKIEQQFSTSCSNPSSRPSLELVVSKLIPMADPVSVGQLQR